MKKFDLGENTLPQSKTNSNFPNVDAEDSIQKKQDIKLLAALIARFALQDGRTDLSVPNLHLVKASSPTIGAIHAMSQPGICIVAQGTKWVSLAQESYQYDESSMVVYSTEVPIKARIVKASKEAPFLCLVLHIEPKKLMDLILKVFPNGIPKKTPTKAIYLGSSDHSIVKSCIRILELLIQDESADLLVPLIIEEVLIRLLRSPYGACIAQIGLADSAAYKISRAISWIKDNAFNPITIEELAKIAHMSPSSFHTHFKSITSMSPLQFQKNLRLQSARALMIQEMMDVSRACMTVGYSSISQFSREYSRLFNISPSKDIARYRTI
ncbi:MAG: AraC family transcriptional regulator [Colwellia sp.]|nr:AraC family transcriptional regulator [Colwellia sp.]